MRLRRESLPLLLLLPLLLSVLLLVVTLVLVVDAVRYDAVTVEGALRWQNSLTALNAPFFDLADALFVNYNWTPARMPSAGD